MSLVTHLVSGFAQRVVLGQARTYLPVTAGVLTTLGVQHQVSATSLEGALYYILSSAFVIVPALFSYLQKKSMKTLVTAAIAATPGTPEAVAIQAKVD
jgi:hypothetical protein